MREGMARPTLRPIAMPGNAMRKIGPYVAAAFALAFASFAAFASEPAPVPAQPALSAPECEVWTRELGFARSVATHDAEAFAGLLHRLQDGDDFDAAFAQTYQANPNRLAQAFFACVDAGLAPEHPLCAAEGTAPAGSP